MKLINEHLNERIFYWKLSKDYGIEASMIRRLSDVLNLLLRDTREQGISQIALAATDMVRLLYEKYGFGEMELV